jgi:hypothetical protein
MQVISASRSEWIAPFTGLEPGQFRTLVRLVAQRGGDKIADGRPGRQCGWTWPTACCWWPPTGAPTSRCANLDHCSGSDVLLTRLLAVADAAGVIDWSVSVDSTIARAHQHATSITRDIGGWVELQESADRAA